ncbi:hypothetical protein L596_010249 [Steinernema carpocapsae]|uniref:Uncharacterized protein n=1 Tax=Steinernema carpocapsae TaxID=34508 RepID=A0A4U5PJ32_STECR|nr:hypothetical protein L596_010249 [Steinernema carpocapsae]
MNQTSPSFYSSLFPLLSKASTQLLATHFSSPNLSAVGELCLANHTWRLVHVRRVSDPTGPTWLVRGVQENPGSEIRPIPFEDFDDLTILSIDCLAFAPFHNVDTPQKSHSGWIQHPDLKNHDYDKYLEKPSFEIPILKLTQDRFLKLLTCIVPTARLNVKFLDDFSEIDEVLNVIGDRFSELVIDACGFNGSVYTPQKCIQRIMLIAKLKDVSLCSVVLENVCILDEVLAQVPKVKLVNLMPEMFFQYHVILERLRKILTLVQDGKNDKTWNVSYTTRFIRKNVKGFMENLEKLGFSKEANGYKTYVFDQVVNNVNCTVNVTNHAANNGSFMSLGINPGNFEVSVNVTNV